VSCHVINNLSLCDLFIAQHRAPLREQLRQRAVKLAQIPEIAQVPAK
jgi:hypothetical protein